MIDTQVQNTPAGPSTWKRRARHMLDRIAATSGLLSLREQQMRGTLTILMYHRILPAAHCDAYPLASLAIPEHIFRAQVQWLADHCRILPVRDALAALCGTHADVTPAQDRPLIAVTFDDGYIDNAEIAAPILESRGLRATFFIATDFVGKNTPFWFDRAADAWLRMTGDQRTEIVQNLLASLPPAAAASCRSCGGIRTWLEGLKQTDPALRETFINTAERAATGTLDAAAYAPMTIDHTRQLHERGHEIGSHTVTHPILPQVPDASLATELAESRLAIHRWIGEHPAGFCYPNGDLDPRVEDAVNRAGYAYACTTRTGRNTAASPMLRLARVPIVRQHVLDTSGAHDELGFRAELCGLRAWCRDLRPRRTAIASGAPQQ